MLEDSKKTSRSIFSAISRGSLIEVNEILDRDSSVLNQIGSSKYTPIFHAILGKKKEIVDAIINRDPSVLNQESSSGNTPISLAIQSGNLDIVKAIIKKASWVLGQKDSKGDTPIFIAIRSGNLDIVKAILEEDRSVLSVLKQENSSGDTPITLATLISVISSSRDKEGAASEVLRVILEKKFPGNIDKASQEDFKELFLQESFLKGLYSEEEAPFKFNSLKKAFDKITPKNTLGDIYKELLENVDKNKSIDLKNGEKMFIFQSHLQQHQSFFIFRVNKANELTSISYCDGNLFDERQKIKDSATHINGVTTFHLKAPIEYSYEKFVKNFIEKNTQNQKIEDFYKKYSEKTIAIEGAEIDYAKTTHSIPTKAQKRGNCAFKGPSVAVRKIFQELYPTKEFGFGEASQKPTGDVYDEYKKFKDGLTKNALNFIIKIKEKISSKSDPLSEHLKKDIEGIMKMVETHNKKKLSKDDQPRKEFHRAIKNVLIGHEQETPGSSCFPFFRSCFTLKNTSPQP